MNSRFVKNMISLFNSQIEDFADFLSKEHPQITRVDVLKAWCDLQKQPYSTFGISEENPTEKKSSSIVEVEFPDSDDDAEETVVVKRRSVKKSSTPRTLATRTLATRTSAPRTSTPRTLATPLSRKSSARRTLEKLEAQVRENFLASYVADEDDDNLQEEKPKRRVKSTKSGTEKKSKSGTEKRTPSKNSSQCTYVFTRGVNVGCRCTIMAKSGIRCSKHKKSGPVEEIEVTEPTPVVEKSVDIYEDKDDEPAEIYQTTEAQESEEETDDEDDE